MPSSALDFGAGIESLVSVGGSGPVAQPDPNDSIQCGAARAYVHAFGPSGEDGAPWQLLA